MLIINYFFFFKVSRLHVCFDFERESLETPKRTQRRPDGTCLENPSDYTDGRTDGAHLPTPTPTPPTKPFAFAPSSLCVVFSFIYPTVAPSIFFLFCFVIRPVTLDREVGKRTVKEGAGSYKSKKKKKKKRVMTSMAQTARINTQIQDRFSQLVCKKGVGSAVVHQFLLFLTKCFSFSFSLKKKQKTRKIERRSVSCRPTQRPSISYAIHNLKKNDT